MEPASSDTSSARSVALQTNKTTMQRKKYKQNNHVMPKLINSKHNIDVDKMDSDMFTVATQRRPIVHSRIGMSAKSRLTKIEEMAVVLQYPLIGCEDIGFVADNLDLCLGPGAKTKHKPAIILWTVVPN